MTTGQKQIKVYIPDGEDAAFRAAVAAEERTLTAVLRRLIREYIATAKEPQ